MPETIRVKTPAVSSVPSTITGFGISANFETVMFYFDPVNDIDLDSYAYQLYDISNPTSSTTPIASGKNKANVFTISVTNSTDSTPKTYYGRVAVVNSAGTVGTYTNLVSSGATPLIGEQYITSLTAAKITTGTLGAHTITLGGTNSVIKSSTYDGSWNGSQWTTGDNGWLISGSGQAIFDATQIRGSVSAASINLNTHNYWLPNAGTPIFKVGNATNFFEWDGTNVRTTGTIVTNATVSGGTVGGVSAGTDKIFIGTGTFNNANTAFYVDNAGRFSLKDKFVWTGSALTIAGDVTIGSQSATAVSTAVTTANNAATAAANAQSTADSKINGAAVNANVTSISGGVITTGTINLNSVNVRTATSGARLDIDSSGIKIYNSAGTNTASLNSDGSASFSGSITGATGQFAGDIIGGQGEFVYEDASQATLRVVRRTGGSYANAIVALIWKRPSDGALVRIGNLRWLAAEQSNFSTTPTWIFGEGIRAEEATNLSDIRLKNITNKEIDALQILKKLKTTEFFWKDTEDARKYGDPNKKEYGYIAQQVHEIIPEATVVGNDELDENGKIINKWYVLDSKLTPYLVRSMQQLCDRIEYLESKLNE